MRCDSAERIQGYRIWLPSYIHRQVCVIVSITAVYVYNM